MDSLAFYAKKLRRFFVTGIVVFLFCLPVFGQSNLGSISGSITDYKTAA